MREVVLDTETTGLRPEEGDRIVEIGCIELVNHLPTGRHFHAYVNPERAMDAAAFRVHGISGEMLADKPVFADIAEPFLEFIGDAPLVIHNAAFDIGFLDMELARIGRPKLGLSRGIDTVAIARQKFPGAQASLDALCKRFNIDDSVRSKHGALVDAGLLAQVYLELVGGRQQGLGLAGDPAEAMQPVLAAAPRGPARPIRPHAPTADELAAHAAFVAKLKEPIWTRS